MLTNIAMLHWLWLLPLLIIFCVVTAHKRNGRLKCAGGPNTRTAVASAMSHSATVFRVILVLFALIALIIALAGPAWNPIEETIKREGRDVVFVLDVSKSMLAEDLRPNRLERAKIDIADCLESLNGDRVALVVFAGTANVQCPLTQDYGFFRMMLADVSTESVARGGTAIGDALRVTQKQVFDEQDKAYRDIILITDGEDHDSFPVEAAKEIGAKNIRLIAIGIGDDTNGTPIPITDPASGLKRNLTYKGEIVRSKLDSATLKQMAEATPEGIFLPVATNTMDLRAIYSQLIAHAARRAMATEQVTRLQPKFQIFIGISMLFLALAMLLPRGHRSIPNLIIIMALIGTANSSWAASTAQKFLQEGNAAADAGNNAGAIEKYLEAEKVASPEKLPYIQYNRALAQTPEAPEDAEKTLNDAKQQAFDPEFQANCLTASGNIKYHQAEKLATSSQSLNEAKNAIEQSIKYYNDAIALTPNTTTIAKENLKTARLKRQQILQQLRQQPEQQQQDKQEQKQDQQNQQNDQQNQEQQQPQQEQQNQQNDQQNQEQQQPQQEQQNQQNQEQQSQDQQTQQEQQKQNEQKQNQEQEQQQVAASKAQQSEDEKQPEEAKPLDRALQQIIDGEKLHRMQQRTKQSRQSPVDKDW